VPPSRFESEPPSNVPSRPKPFPLSSHSIGQSIRFPARSSYWMGVADFADFSLPSQRSWERGPATFIFTNPRKSPGPLGDVFDMNGPASLLKARGISDASDNNPAPLRSPWHTRLSISPKGQAHESSNKVIPPSAASAQRPGGRSTPELPTAWRSFSLAQPDERFHRQDARSRSARSGPKNVVAWGKKPRRESGRPIPVRRAQAWSQSKASKPHRQLGRNKERSGPEEVPPPRIGPARDMKRCFDRPRRMMNAAVVAQLRRRNLAAGKTVKIQKKNKPSSRPAPSLRTWG